MSRFLIVFLISFIVNPTLHAQQQQAWSGFGIESNVMIGKMIRHNARFTGPIPAQSYSFEINLLKKTYGQKDWQQRRNYPQLGLGFYYNNYNMPDIYGQVFGIFPNIQLNLIRGNHFEWTLRAGMGVCYDTKPYERLPVKNTENVAIGGHWNNISPFSTDIRWKIDQHWDLQAGINFSHVSNAAFQQPNLGINMYGAHIGVRYFPVTSNPEKIRRNLTPLKNRWLIQARVGGSFIESSPADGPLNPVYIGAAYVSKRYWSKNKVYAGFDYCYNSAKYAKLKSIEHFQGEEYKQSTQAAVFLGNEFLVGRLGILFQLGYYLHRMDEQQEKIYQKIGGNFYFVQKEKGLFKEMFFSAILKTHMANAELFEMGIGVGL
jgi:hypothetical protein